MICTIFIWSLVVSSYSKRMISSTPYRTDEVASDLGELVVETEYNVLVFNVNEFEKESFEMRPCSSTMVAEEEQFVN